MRLAAGHSALNEVIGMLRNPYSTYMLGITAPQPDWRMAYALVRSDAARTHTDITTISPYPLLHDLYIGRDVGKKFYVPISFGGHPGGVSWSGGHTIAPTLATLDELKAMAGYVLMDEMALRMAGVVEMKDYLSTMKPLAVIQGPFKVYVWKIKPE